jgi:hypothetical protein
MKNIPELPPAFAIPQEYRQSLPAEVQEWLASVEMRIDGLTLRRIEKEAEELAGDGSPEEGTLYRLGRRLFYNRMQQIFDLMLPGQHDEIGIDITWEETMDALPGWAVTDAVTKGYVFSDADLSQEERAGVEVD